MIKEGKNGVRNTFHSVFRCGTIYWLELSSLTGLPIQPNKK